MFVPDWLKYLFHKEHAFQEWIKCLDLIFERKEFQLCESAIAKDRLSSQAKKNIRSNCPQVRLGKSNGEQEGVLLGPDPRYKVC